MDCPICFSGYCEEAQREPCILGCGHTFCKACLHQLSGRGLRAVVVCPSCRVESRRRDVKVNFALRDAVLEASPERRLAQATSRTAGSLAGSLDVPGSRAAKWSAHLEVGLSTSICCYFSAYAGAAGFCWTSSPRSGEFPLAAGLASALLFPLRWSEVVCFGRRHCEPYQRAVALAAIGGAVWPLSVQWRRGFDLGGLDRAMSLRCLIFALQALMGSATLGLAYGGLGCLPSSHPLRWAHEALMGQRSGLLLRTEGSSMEAGGLLAELLREARPHLGGGWWTD